MSKAKEVLLFELDEQSHPERVEDVIYWALKYYYENRKKGTWGETIAYYLVKTIEEAERCTLHVDEIKVSEGSNE
ncbi:MAG: hypothetical protein ACRC9P_03535 [Bacteroides sp.]